ncbi:hypothetical protein [Deinococcus kurensis]|uniref:hypothetical protein n=1 Tax=Deinococcus kurensis TaxID=2662757 RepID=UPI0012D2E226|nr:hypothetical protein [Deinococcus kurensis]
MSVNVTLNLRGRAAEDIVKKALANFAEEKLDVTDLADRGAHLGQLERAVARDFGEFLYSAVTGQKSGNKNQDARQKSAAFDVHRQFMPATRATERVYAWLARKPQYRGSMYRYMATRRMNARNDADRQKMLDEVAKARKRDRNKRQRFLQAKLDKLVSRRLSEVQKPHALDAATPDWRPSYKRTRAANPPAAPHVTYYRTGRMAQGLAENATASVTRTVVDDTEVTVAFSVGVKPSGHWTDKEAAMAFKFMSKRSDFIGPLSEGVRQVLPMLMKNRLGKRDDARWRASQIQKRDVAAAAADTRKVERAAQTAQKAQAAAADRAARIAQREAASAEKDRLKAQAQAERKAARAAKQAQKDQRRRSQLVVGETTRSAQAKLNARLDVIAPAPEPAPQDLRPRARRAKKT